MFFSLTESANRIGISRAWLYRKYLPRYRPIVIADHPMLSREQIAQIKAEIKADERQKQSNGNGHNRK
jgi:predicted DNA-binding transcriptional regulator AlpA